MTRMHNHGPWDHQTHAGGGGKLYTLRRLASGRVEHGGIQESYKRCPSGYSIERKGTQAVRTAGRRMVHAGSLARRGARRARRGAWASR